MELERADGEWGFEVQGGRVTRGLGDWETGRLGDWGTERFIFSVYLFNIYCP
jgi:hypothetical protein